MIPWGLAGAADVLNIHPLFVHFPVAFLPVAAAFYWLGIVSGREQPAVAGKWALFAGTVSALLAVWTGWNAAGTVPHEGGVHGLLQIHMNFGFAIAGLSLLLSGWVMCARASVPGKWRPLFLGSLLLLALLVIQTADFGGRMVFLHGVGVGRKSMLETGQTPEPAGAGHEHGGHSH
ncbi:MAG: DUF2231 domain-containing protein [Candidatus Omnitrophica bacterium]|nr:DUF2231 domain-containing protein [Candidatus Omnitrophota bacterium]